MNTFIGGAKAVLRSWGQDHHGAGCKCGSCNANGKSYGCAVMSEDDCYDPIHVYYAASEEAAEHNARLACRIAQIEIQEECE
jgi:hypothetical protein